MEANEVLDSGMTSGKIIINQQMKADFKVTKTWTLVLAVLGFIFSALMLIGTLGSLMTVTGGGPGGIFSVIMMIFLLALYIYPSWCLFKYSQNIGSALTANNQELMNTAFLYMRRYFKFIGIITVCILALYVIMIIFGGIATIF